MVREDLTLDDISLEDRSDISVCQVDFDTNECQQCPLHENCLIDNCDRDFHPFDCQGCPAFDECSTHTNF